MMLFSGMERFVYLWTDRSEAKQQDQHGQASRKNSAEWAVVWLLAFASGVETGRISKVVKSTIASSPKAG